MAPPTICDLTMEDASADNGPTLRTEGEKLGTATPARSAADFEDDLDVAATTALEVVGELDVVRRCVAPICACVL
jgi:hypothetical protein